MGNNQSIDPVHLRIYTNIIQIHDHAKRVQMINTCLASMEYVGSAKRAGIYSYLLNYIAIVHSGGSPPLLPGENTLQAPQGQQVVQAFQAQQSLQAQQSQQTQQAQQSQKVPRSLSMHQTDKISTYTDNTPSWKIITDTSKQKAMTYFSSCLEVLGIQEEVALTDESLKIAYKKMARKAHPDKGGSEEYFEAVTRAYAYLSEILKHMEKRDITSKVEAPSTLNVSRDNDSEKWKHTEPVHLNSKKLDMNAFNSLFEKTHMPDPDSDGYGDWLKGDMKSAGPKFKGEFNRDVFNRMFDDEAKKNQRSSSLIVHPGEMALTLNPTNGVDLVGERPDSYTAAPNSRFQFTDLRGAYTSESTISDKVSNVHVGERNYEQYRASRDKAPDPFNQSEMHSIHEFETRQKKLEELRERKRGEMSVRNQQYFDRMKQMVITEGFS